MRKSVFPILFVLICVSAGCSFHQSPDNTRQNGIQEEKQEDDDMGTYLNVEKFGNEMCLSFYIQHDNIMEIGSQMEEINENAYMNGYNWEAFLECYLDKNAPDLLDGLDTDSEAGMYSAQYPYTEENEQKAKKYEEIIRKLVENPEEIYRFLRENGDDISWN